MNDLTQLARSYGRGLSTTAGSAAIPYGYTLTVWATGTLLTSRHPEHGLFHVVLFVAGAAAGYGLVRVASGRSPSRGPRGITRHRVIRGGIVHSAAIGSALALVDGLIRLPAIWAWPSAPLAATAAYLSVTAVEETLSLIADERRDR